MTDFSPEMRVFDTSGRRLYLNKQERGRFLEAAKQEDRANRVYYITPVVAHQKA